MTKEKQEYRLFSDIDWDENKEKWNRIYYLKEDISYIEKRFIVLMIFLATLIICIHLVYVISFNYFGILFIGAILISVTWVINYIIKENKKSWSSVNESFKTKAGAKRYVSGQNGIIVEEREDES